VNLDLWCLLLVGTFAFTAMFQGASGQVARVLAMAVATLLGYLLGPWAGAHLMPSLPSTLRSILGGLVLGVVAYLLFSWFLRNATRRIVARNVWGKADRVLGFLLGALQGAYLAWILVTTLPMINEALASRGSHLRFHTEGSWAAHFVAEHPLPFQPPSEKLRDAKDLKKTIDRFKKLDLPLGNGT
jgi:uncharacterized membrane protein required for colicin V production